MKKELQKELDKAHEMLRALSDKVNGLPEQEFEVGKWYYVEFLHFYNPYKWVVRYTHIEGGCVYGNAFNLENTTWISGCVYELRWERLRRPATPSEAQEALTKEAVKIGYEGKTIKCIRSGSTSGTVANGRFVYYEDCDELVYVTGKRLYSLYYKGVWAEIVKDQPITICGKVVNYDNDCGLFSVYGQNYLPEDLSVLAKLMQKGQIKSLNVGCNGQEKVDLQLIESLINRINKG